MGQSVRLPQPTHSKEDDMTMLTTQEQQEIDKRLERRGPSARPGSLASEERRGACRLCRIVNWQECATIALVLVASSAQPS